MRSQHETIYSSLQRISIASYIFQSRIADEFGLHPRDLEAISCLSLHGALSAGALSRMLDLTSGATTALIGRLVDASFVKRKADPDDRRRVLVQLGGARLARLRSRYGEVGSRVERALAGLTPDNVRVVATFLARLTGD